MRWRDCLRERNVQTTDCELPLTEAASDVLESMCFLSLAGIVDEPVKAGDDAIVCRLEFYGESQGYFGLAASVNTAGVIAENFLGQPVDELSRIQIEEVLCELSNMICGSFLSRIRKDAIFDLTHPRCTADTAQTFERFSENAVVQTLDLDDGRRLYLWLEFNS